ncbi:PEP-CTERM sorting domain-containing protein [Methylibium sp.]|uniref:PEP-CTERM sorting domain-containing protein n=1 Tax=Methylibium sp. TaxID=2067992 RepID=UPI0017D494FA|nr:PEP-CTERM sorting domain-containing protein [Methylibium sp.]
MTGFWPNGGAISHVSIWGREADSTVPEPGTLALVGLALGAVGVLRRKRIR